MCNLLSDCSCSAIPALLREEQRQKAQAWCCFKMLFVLVQCSILHEEMFAFSHAVTLIFLVSSTTHSIKIITKNRWYMGSLCFDVFKYI